MITNSNLPTIPRRAVSRPASTASAAVLSLSSQPRALPSILVLALIVLLSLQQLVCHLLHRRLAPTDCLAASCELDEVQGLAHSATYTADPSHLSTPVITSNTHKKTHLQTQRRTERHSAILSGCRIATFVWNAIQTTSAVISDPSARCLPVTVCLLETELSLSLVLDCRTVCDQILSQVTICHSSTKNSKHSFSDSLIPLDYFVLVFFFAVLVVFP